MKKIFLLMLVMLMGLTMQAQEKKKKNAKYNIEVKGNCEMCKKRIEKAAFGVSGVKYADWHADHQDIHLIIDENKCSIDDVRKAIAKTGHDTDTVKAKDEDYEGLHNCCQYDRG
ncbi:metal transporter [Flavobacterium salilacus subsp. salilacus]|uniref:heavy-metal-associated domain-containing protein n=1 Tax=Flavobacterium TaxID=237 RepID=UPI0010751EBF|nr:MULTISPECIES: metal transporter [Flavobacterium]KAF2519883.1 metal transporter [Flavobacterium salilacus subsp. salilacus]MBE1614211.1 metal transporter [Flavobacterium sp. SaA2.13]NDI97706.1 metal transporter [Flavobacterium salilacus subsp. altitudinum]